MTLRPLHPVVRTGMAERGTAMVVKPLFEQHTGLDNGMARGNARPTAGRAG